MFITLLAVFVGLLAEASSLDNVLGRNGILGWTTGLHNKCLTDCNNYPDDCISEHLIRIVADMLTLSSFSTAGYRYIIVGDCWMDVQRDNKGRIRADHVRFPNGMANLVSYLHSKGLKLGLHIDLGTQTCGGYPGSKNHYDSDAQTLSDWGVDLIVAEACGFSEYSDINEAYPEFGESLNRTNSKMIYNCNWPVELAKKKGGRPNFNKVARVCDTFRLLPGPIKSTESLTEALSLYSKFAYVLEKVLAPGSFIDLNQLTIGGTTLSVEQEIFQLTFWSIMKSPLLVSVDLTTIRSSSKRVLLNPQLLSIVNDPLSSVAKQKSKEGMVSIWTKKILPEGSWVLAIFNTNIVGLPSQTSFRLSRAGVIGAGRYNVTEVFTGDHYGVVKPWYYFNCEVEPSSALLFRFIAL